VLSSEEIATADQRISLPAEEEGFGNLDTLETESPQNTSRVRLLGSPTARETRKHRSSVVDECPVSGEDAIIAITGRRNPGDVDTRILKAVDDSLQLTVCDLTIDDGGSAVGIHTVFDREVIDVRYQKMCVNHISIVP
jgi:hypothetical protein